MDIAKASTYHRYLIVAILVQILTFLLLRTASEEAFGVVVLCLWGLNVFFCCQLAVALGRSPVLWGFLGFVGFAVFWIPQILLINAANKIFKSNGLKVGFLGGATRPQS